jgi:translation initiation factor 1
VEAVPARVVAKLRTEKKGRGGKTVTVVYGLPRNPEFLRQLSQALKRACGAGGTVVDGGIEIQGDLGARVRDALEKRGYVVRG